MRGCSRSAPASASKAVIRGNGAAGALLAAVLALAAPGPLPDPRTHTRTRTRY